MPIWVAFASTGANSTRNFLQNLGAEPLLGRDDDEVIGPCKRDYIFSIVFIVFGTIAAAFGVITNVYVHVHDVFFSPH